MAVITSKQVLLLIITLCLATLCVSSHVSASPFSTLNIDLLGRGGGTHGLVAAAGEIDNILWNSSGLGFAGSPAFAAGYMDYLVSLGGGTAAYMGVGERFGYGIQGSYLSSDTYAKTGLDDQVGQSGDTFKYGDLVLGVSGGVRLLPYLSVGTGLKLARYELDDVTGSGVAADLSSTVRIYPLDGTKERRPAVYASLVTRNLVLVRWQNEDGEIPSNCEAGLALRLPGNDLSAGTSVYMGDSGRREIRFGLAARPSSEFEVRLGYRRRVGKFSDSANGLPWERGIMAGFGIGFGRFWIDYTFEDASPLDNIHRFALRTDLARGD
ncbi:MAG: hypothetical protein ABIJ00_06770 [Candidatus Eisenbacteria bacterium]